MQAANQLKPGLGLLLTAELGPEIVGTASAAVAAAFAIPGIACVASFAEKPARETRPYYQPPTHSLKTQDVPRTFLSLLHPRNIAIVLAKNVGLTLLLKFNIYMVELLDYENKRLTAEEQGQLAPAPPKMAQVDRAAKAGAMLAVRELATSFVKTAYEHLFHWRLGHSKAQPFLRNGVAWVVHVLQPKHARSPVSRKVFSYGMALLHANALFYLAECTVSITIHTTVVIRDKVHRPRVKAKLIVKGAAFQLVRCTVLLATTSAMAAVSTLAKPGFGTRAALLLTDQGVNVALQSLAKAALTV